MPSTGQTVEFNSIPSQRFVQPNSQLPQLAGWLSCGLDIARKPAARARTLLIHNKPSTPQPESVPLCADSVRTLRIRNRLPWHPNVTHSTSYIRLKRRKVPQAPRPPRQHVTEGSVLFWAPWWWCSRAISLIIDDKHPQARPGIKGISSGVPAFQTAAVKTVRRPLAAALR